jgi:hypothetical protein
MKLVKALRRHMPNTNANGSIRRGQIVESAVSLFLSALHKSTLCLRKVKALLFGSE